MASLLASRVVRKAAALSNIGTTETIFAHASNAAQAAWLRIPGNSVLDGKVFRINANVRFTTAASSTAKITLYYGTSLTVSSNTSVTALTARTFATTSGNCRLVAEFLWDSTSKVVNGVLLPASFNGTTPTIETAAVTTQLTAVDWTVDTGANTTTTATPLNAFVLSATFGTGNAGNIATLTDMTLEAL